MIDDDDDDNYHPNPDEDNCPRCEACGANLDIEACRCGPAGPCINGVWTAENAKQGRNQ